MTTWYAQLSGEWQTAQWNDAQDGSGTSGMPADGDTADFNGNAVTLASTLNSSITLQDSVNSTPALELDSGAIIDPLNGDFDSGGVDIALNAVSPPYAIFQSTNGHLISVRQFRCNGGQFFNNCYTYVSTGFSGNASMAFINNGALDLSQIGAGFALGPTTLLNSGVVIATNGQSVTVSGGIQPLFVPDPSDVHNGVSYGISGIWSADGTYTETVPAASDVRNGVAVGGGTGTLVVPATTDVKSGVVFDNGSIGSYSGGSGSRRKIGV